MAKKARGRMLDRDISNSQAVNRLSYKAALVYTWLLAHLDDQGRMSGDPKAVRGDVVPLRNIPPKEMSAILHALEAEDLVILYSAKRRGCPNAQRSPSCNSQAGGTTRRSGALRPASIHPRQAGTRTVRGRHSHGTKAGSTGAPDPD